MKFLHPNVPLLSVAQALMMSTNSLIVSSAALVGYRLAANKSLATLPLAIQFIAVMCASVPAALLMQRIGRKRAFLVACGFGILGGVITCTAIIQGQFWWFVAGTTCVGIFNGFGNYFRFTAADSVEVAYKSKAVSFTMLGGVVAAVAGPTLARHSREWIAGAEFAASYLCIIGIYGLMMLVLSFLDIEHVRQAPGTRLDTGRRLPEILRQPGYIVAVICAMLGYAMMSFVMTATPLAMDQASFVFEQTSVVIQWHVMAMFAPSFFTGSLILRFGVLNIMLAGAVFGLLCVGINLAGTGYWHFLAALVCLGLGWNFLFVGATTLLTETYREEERNKAQAVNDFVVFTTVAVASLSAGVLQDSFGWRVVNMGVMPFLVIIFGAIVFLKGYRSRQAI